MIETVRKDQNANNIAFFFLPEKYFISYQMEGIFVFIKVSVLMRAVLIKTVSWQIRIAELSVTEISSISNDQHQQQLPPITKYI